MRRSGLEERILDGDFSEQAGREAARRILAGQRPDALFCANDMMAIGALEALKEAGVAVPQDIALAGFDDIPIARYVSPPLTTAAVPIAEIGRQRWNAARRRSPAARQQASHVQPQIVIRASSAARAEPQ